MKIILGVAPDQLVVEDGASVPLFGAKNRGYLHLVGELVCLRWGLGGQCVCSLDTASGTLHGSGWAGVAVDLPALRRELAPPPKTVGGWTDDVDLPREPRANGTSFVCLYAKSDRLPAEMRYWTHRPGNTPERQAAFDDAMAGWFYRYAPCNSSSVLEHQALIDAARALGYSSKTP